MDEDSRLFSVPRWDREEDEVEFDYSSHDGICIIGRDEWLFETRWGKASDKSIHGYNDASSIEAIALCRGVDSIAEVGNAKTLDFTSRSRTPAVGDVLVLLNKNGYYAAVRILEVKDDTRGAVRDSLRFRYAIQTDRSDDFSAIGVNQSV